MSGRSRVARVSGSVHSRRYQRAVVALCHRNVRLLPRCYGRTEIFGEPMDIVVTGAGIGGLTTALLLAADGHEVTVLERDPARVPDPERAWDDWIRRGVNQFKLPHFFAPRFRSIL